MGALLLVACLLQDSAADFYKKVEEKYAAAKSLSLTSEVEILSTKDDVERIMNRSEGKLRSKGEGRIHAEYSIRLGDKPMLIGTYISDGRALLTQHAHWAPEKKDHALPLGTWARRFSARLGLTASIGSSFGAVQRSDEVKLDKLFVVSEVADGGREKIGKVECRVVTYNVTQIQEGAPPLKCRAWIDPANLAVLKHEVTDRTTVIRETHSNVTFDADLPDDQFKIP
jgi:outer membrane lipoprotein-sorting protein